MANRQNRCRRLRFNFVDAGGARQPIFCEQLLALAYGFCRHQFIAKRRDALVLDGAYPAQIGRSVRLLIELLRRGTARRAPALG